MESVEKKPTYATFGARLGALMIDGVIIFVSFIVLVPMVIIPLLRQLSYDGGAFTGGFLATGIFMYFFGLPMFGVLYRAAFECSSLQGTPGKVIVGIKVVDSSFGRVSFPRSLLRNFVKIFSSMIFYIGYLVALRDNKCLTWHDLAADTFVVIKDKEAF